MNLLAHAYLARHTDEWMVGALLGDFIKGSVPLSYPLAIQRSVFLHRRIDSFTDRHPVTLASRQLIPRSRRRYAGIVVDIFYDHFLASRWPAYSNVPLTEFTQQVYRALQAYAVFLPTKLNAILPRLVATDRLASYRYLHEIFDVLAGLGNRLRRPIDLSVAAGDLIEHYQEFGRHFEAFFPELRAYCEKQIALGNAG